MVTAQRRPSRGKPIPRRATGASDAIQATSEERSAATRLVRRIARDERDAQELLDALGLDPTTIQGG